MQALRNVGKFRGYRVPGVLRGLGGFAGCWVQKEWGSRGCGLYGYRHTCSVWRMVSMWV